MSADFLNPELLPFLAAVLAGAPIGVCFLWMLQRYRLLHFKQLAAELIRKAEGDADAIRRNADFTAQQKLFEQQKEIDQRMQNERRKLATEEERLKQREDRLDSRMGQLEKGLADTEKQRKTLSRLQEEVAKEKELAKADRTACLAKLESLAGLSAQQAKEILLQETYQQVRSETASYVRKAAQEAREQADREASSILATAINRLAVPCVSEAAANTVSIPNEEMKGRIIGREGRNIRAFEQAAGITVIIDDTPGAVVLSGFDPVRMQIAKTALSALVNDGRIHPTSIEEAIAKAKAAVEIQTRHYGEDAAIRAGIVNLHPELIMLLGRLKYRFSYGQNILEHSLEVAHLMGMMASELGLDTALAKRIGLLHDFGKAVTHEVEGSHATIGYNLALKYGETIQVANGIGCHHGEMEPLTVEGSLCAAADAISASRLGARSEFIEEYVKRLHKLEQIACEFPAVEKAYALQAGREVRVVVLPDAIDDDGIVLLARDMTKRIEQSLTYPGKIKVTIIREKRIVEYAS